MVQGSDGDTSATAMAGGVPYPVRLDAEFPQHPSRFWAIPIIGYVAKLVILIPQIIVIYVLALVAGLAQLVLWIPVLLNGRYPRWGYALMGAYLSRWIRLAAYLYGLTDQYPPFSTGEVDYAAVLHIEAVDSVARWQAIPLIGFVVKVVLLVPHLIAVYGLSLAASVILLAAWAPVLFKGSYPRWAFGLLCTTLRWSVRVQAYLLGLTDRYPPFQAEN